MQLAQSRWRYGVSTETPYTDRREDCPPGSHATGHAGPHQGGSGLINAPR
jgi:hypothetical protein